MIRDAEEAESAADFSPGRAVVPREADESRTDVGLFHPEEVDRVVDYYSTAVAAQAQLDAIADGESAERFVYDTTEPLLAELEAAECLLARRSTRRVVRSLDRQEADRLPACRRRP